MERRRGAQPGHRYYGYRTSDPPQGVPIRVWCSSIGHDGHPFEHFAPGLWVFDPDTGDMRPVNDAAFQWLTVAESPEWFGWARPLPPRRQKPEASGAPPKVGG